MSLVLGLGLEHSCPWPRECLSSERLSLALALASDFFCVLGLGLGLEPCVLDSTSDSNDINFKVPSIWLYIMERKFNTLLENGVHFVNIAGGIGRKFTFSTPTLATFASFF